MASGSDGIRRNLTQATNDLRKSFDNLSSGKKSPRENPAAAAVAQVLEADAAQISVSSRNVADAGSLINTFESATSQVGGILERMSELATQASNGTLSDSQRSTLNAEFDQLKQEVARQTGSTQFNGVEFGEQVSIEIGGGSPQLSVSTGDPSQLNQTLSSLSISSLSGAQNALTSLGQAADSINQLKASFGASQSRLETIGSTLETDRVAKIEAASRITDVDVAEEVAKSTAASIRQQGATAALNSFKNISAQTISQLLS